MLPCAQVCQRARAKASAASVAIRAATTGRSVLDTSERDGGVPASGPPLATPGPPADRVPFGPSDMTDSAARIRAAECS